MTNEFSWGKALAAGVVSTGVVVGGLYLGTNFGHQTVDLSKVATKEDLAKALNLTVVPLDALDAKVTDLQAVLLKDDAWESAAKVLALEELEDRDYKALGRFILNDSAATSDDVDELSLDVTVRDVDYSAMDSDEQNGVVKFELRVRYEDLSGDDQKTTVTATVTLEDGEVEDIDFA